MLVPVLEISVLDVLRQPVHGKVHVLCGDGVGHPGEGLEENVVLQLVCVGVARLATLHELLLLVVEMVPEHVPVVVQDVNIIRVFLQLLHDVEEDNVLIVKSLVEDFKGLVPDIGVGNGEGHHVLVPEVSVGDMLGKPVLGKVNPFLGNRGCQSLHGGQQNVVLVYVLVQLLLGVGGRLREQVSLSLEVVLVALKARCQNSIIAWVCFNVCQTAEENLVILVHVLVEDCKEGVPLEGRWDGVNLWEKASVCEVGVLDVLSQPVLDEVGHLLRDWDLCTLHGVHQTQVSLSVVSNVMLVVPNGSEEGLLGTEVLVVESLQAVPQLLVVTVGLHVPDNVEKPDVFVVHLLVTDGKAILPDVRIGNNIVSPEVELSTVGKVGVLDVLSEPVLGLVGRLLGDGQG